MLWSFTVLGILTPEVMALLAEKMLSLPRENFTQEAYIQLYQAKMSLSQHVRFPTVFWLAEPEGLQMKSNAFTKRNASVQGNPAVSGCSRPCLPACLCLVVQVFDIAAYVPPELLSRGETEWRRQAEVLKVSVTHRHAWEGRAVSGLAGTANPDLVRMFLPLWLNLSTPDSLPACPSLSLQGRVKRDDCPWHRPRHRAADRGWADVR